MVWGFVCSGIEQAAGALRDELGAKRWVKNIAGQKLESEGDHFVPFKIAGNDWTNLVDVLVSGKKSLSADLLKTLSKKLKTRTIFAGYESTAGIFLYVLCDNGKVVETLHWDGSDKSELVKNEEAARGGFTFYSNLREVRPGELTGKTVVGFFDAFLKAQRALLVLETGGSRKGQYSFKPHRLKTSEIERTDFIGILSESEMRTARDAKRLYSKLAEAIDECNGAHFWAFKARDEYKDWRHMRPTQAACVKHEARYRRLLSKVKKLIGENIKPQEGWLTSAAREGNEALVEVLSKAAGYPSVPESLRHAAGQAKEEENADVQRVLTYLANRPSKTSC